MTAAAFMTPKAAFDFTSAVLDPRITFARTGATATRFNSSGFIESVAADTPRFDFNPVTLVCRGLLVEDARTNILTRSNDYADASWGRNRITLTANSIDSPDGTTNGALATANATNANGISLFKGPVTIPSGSTITASMFFKKGYDNFVAITVFDNSANGIIKYFNLATGAIGSTVVFGSGWSFATATMEPCANGYYRCTVTVNAVGTKASFVGYPSLPSESSSQCTSGVTFGYPYGAQLEVGASATSYIPTVASTVARNPDIATITGTNFSDWWQASKGGVLVRARPGTVSGMRPWVQFDDNTADNIIALRGNTTNPELYIVDGGTPQAQIDAGTIAANTDYSMTAWWQTNDCKARMNNGAVVTDTTATIPTVTQARLGSDGTNYLNGHLASISYYDSFSEQIYTRRKNKAVFNLM